LGLPWEVLGRDSLLSWILAGIGHVHSLRDSLVFKGGTALKKCYFGDYRFSEDLNFSGIGEVPNGSPMEQAVRAACDAAQELLHEYAPVTIACERHTKRQPHPGGQEAFPILFHRIVLEELVERSLDDLRLVQEALVYRSCNVLRRQILHSKASR
jgi:hypothetical protein